MICGCDMSQVYCTCFYTLYITVTKTSNRDIGFPGGSAVKETACNAGNLGLIPGSGRYPREGNGNLLQYSCMGNPMDRRAWRAIVHGVVNSRTWLRDQTTITTVTYLYQKYLAVTDIIIFQSVKRMIMPVPVYCAYCWAWIIRAIEHSSSTNAIRKQHQHCYLSRTRGSNQYFSGSISIGRFVFKGIHYVNSSYKYSQFFLITFYYSDR